MALQHFANFDDRRLSEGIWRKRKIDFRVLISRPTASGNRLAFSEK
jgi:hypothetical protein